MRIVSQHRNERTGQAGSAVIRFEVEDTGSGVDAETKARERGDAVNRS